MQAPGRRIIGRAAPSLSLAIFGLALVASPALADKVEDAEAAAAVYDDVTALRLFAEALAEPGLKPSVKAAALHGRGDVYVSTQRFTEAVADFTAALEVVEDPAQRAGILVSRAESYDALQKYAEALKDYDASLALAPKQIGVHTARANVYQRLGDTKSALAAFDAELQLHPGFYRALSARAVILNLPLPRNPTEGR